ncbi:MAG: hypothetical protein PHG47_03780 [Sulfuricella sp.]|nr:hypothetical protein [Sulfuricella sp.]
MNEGLLLGAGFSYDLGMPLSKELTETFLGLFDKKNTVRLVVGMSEQSPYSDERPINRDAISESFDLLLAHKEEGVTKGVRSSYVA